MKNKFKILPVLIILILALAAFLYFPKRPRADYIFLITLDTTRADHIDYSLDHNQLTPNLARLAAEGHFFNHAFSLIPITLPSHFSMFYSQPPHRLQIYNNQQSRSVPEPSLTELLKKAGYQAGAVISLGVLEPQFGLAKGFDRYISNFKPGLFYRTAEEVNRDAMSLIGNPPAEKAFYWIHYSDPHGPYFTPDYGDGHFTISLNQQQIYRCKTIEQINISIDLDLPPGENSIDFSTVLPEKVSQSKETIIKSITLMDFKIKSSAKAGDYMVLYPENWERVKARNYDYFKTFSHQSKMRITNSLEKPVPITLSFVYMVYVPPAPSQKLYREAITYMDREIGRFIDFLKEKKLYQRSTFIIMGDHGEGLGEHRNLIGHIHYLNKLYTQVPLIISGKGINNRGGRDEPVSNLNIAPTILDLAGIEKPAHMLGTSLLKTLPHRSILLETYSPEAYHDGFSLLDYPLQIIYYPKQKKNNWEFFNLKMDKLGTKKISGKGKLHNEKVKLRKALKGIATSILSSRKKGGKISQKHRDILKTLGYL